MESITHNGEKYLATQTAAEQFSYARDYIGELCRSGDAQCVRVGRSWFIRENDLLERKGITPEENTSENAGFEVREAEGMIIQDGMKFVSSDRAAILLDYSRDYIGQLIRKGLVPAQKVGRTWYVDLDTLRVHRTESAKNAAKARWQKMFAQQERERAQEYLESVGEAPLPPQEETTPAEASEGAEEAVTTPEEEVVGVTDTEERAEEDSSAEAADDTSEEGVEPDSQEEESTRSVPISATHGVLLRFLDDKEADNTKASDLGKHDTPSGNTISVRRGTKNVARRTARAQNSSRRPRSRVLVPVKALTLALFVSGAFALGFSSVLFVQEVEFQASENGFSSSRGISIDNESFEIPSFVKTFLASVTSSREKGFSSILKDGE